MIEFLSRNSFDIEKCLALVKRRRPGSFQGCRNSFDIEKCLARGASKASAGAEQAAKPKSSASSNESGSVYTEIVPDCKKKTLQAVIRGRVSLYAVVHSDKWRGYDGLVDVGYSKHLRVNHSAVEFVNGTSHINGIESFWSFSKRRLQKFNGVSKKSFYLHLKECEYRFNNRKQNLLRLLLKLLENNPL